MELQGVMNRLAGTTGLDAQGAANAITGRSLSNIVYPVGHVLTYPAFALGGPVTGMDTPEFGALGSPLVAFDKDAPEGMALPLGSLVPPDWETFKVHFEALALGGGDVVWRVNKSNEGDLDTTITYAGGAMEYKPIAPATTFTFDEIVWTADFTAKGGGLVISRVATDEDDDLDGDIHLGAVGIERVS